MTHPLFIRLATSSAALRIAPHVLPRCDLFIHRLTRGRLLPSRLVLDTIVLGTTGHRSGTPRHAPLAAHRAADGTWLVIGSNFGPPHHPAWTTNLLHRPHTTVTTRGLSLAGQGPPTHRSRNGTPAQPHPAGHPLLRHLRRPRRPGHPRLLPHPDHRRTRRQAAQE
ncbi:nitroreductase/quinone reductase family protein [Streptomyces qaidamensis]|uniref:nitroreductase/quinone reductase family protein n=1 Tax=Streptomyces qaidamensis TaxID=1783515 RepID=UPI003663B157